MTSFQFVPLFGPWWLTALISAILVAAFGIGVALFVRNRQDNDARVIDWVRRGAVVLLLVVAAAGPSTVTLTQRQAVNAIDVFFAVDVTGSMAVDDAHYGSDEAQTRLDVARQAVSDVVSQYPGASYAGVSFGTTSSLGVPLTPDSRALNLWAESLTPEPTSVSSGTSPDAPLDTLIRAMQQSRESHPDNTIVLYYFSDGEKTSESDRRTFSTLRTFVDGGAVIGTGSTAGGRVPLVRSDAGASEETQWVTDPETGTAAISRMDDDQLRQIADEVSIEYLHVDATMTAEQLEALTSSQYRLIDTETTRTHVTRFVWPLALAIFALILWEAADVLTKVRRIAS